MCLETHVDHYAVSEYIQSGSDSIHFQIEQYPIAVPKTIDHESLIFLNFCHVLFNIFRQF